MQSVWEFIMLEFELINSLITPDIKHNMKLCEVLLEYIEVLQVLAVVIHEEELAKKVKRRAWVWP